MIFQTRSSEGEVYSLPIFMHFSGLETAAVIINCASTAAVKDFNIQFISERPGRSNLWEARSGFGVVVV